MEIGLLVIELDLDLWIFLLFYFFAPSFSLQAMWMGRVCLHHPCHFFQILTHIPICKEVGRLVLQGKGFSWPPCFLVHLTLEMLIVLNTHTHTHTHIKYDMYIYNFLLRNI